MESRSRDVLDAALARGMTAVCGERLFEKLNLCTRERALPLPCGRGRIASTDAIRVRGSAPSIDHNPSPQPSPTRGEGAHCRCGDIDANRPCGLRLAAPYARHRCAIWIGPRQCVMLLPNP